MTPPGRLGRVLDPAALDAADGPRAVLRVEAPAEWLDRGGEFELRAPALLACGHCDGGGCDACGRSGALRSPADADLRLVRATLPPSSARGVAVRITRPFGVEAGVDQLIVEIRAGADTGALVRIRLAERARPPFGARALVAFAIASLVVTAVVSWFAWR